MKTTAEKIKHAIEIDNDFDRESIAEHDQILSILRELEGKPINGRTLNEKRLNGLKFSDKYGMFHIEGKRSHLIGYNSTPFVSVENFEKFDSCNGNAARERIKKNEEILNGDKFKNLCKLVQDAEEAYQKLKNTIKEIEAKKFDSYNFPAHYRIMELLQPEAEERKKIDISRLKYC